MINYSLDTNEREKTYFILAIVSAAILPLLNNLIAKSGLEYLIAPSTMLVFLFLVSIYSKWLWRISSLFKISGIPDLNGKYAGSTTRNNGEVIELKATICQSWRKIDFVIESEGTTGTTRTAGFFIENRLLNRLNIIYSVSPTKAPIEESISYGEGVDHFRISKVDGCFILKGLSYSSKLRGGEIVLKKLK
jgi:hypothetical protein